MAMTPAGLAEPSILKLSEGRAPWIFKMPRQPRCLPGPICGVLLDACNVLYDDTAWRRWLLRLLVRLGLRTCYGPFFRVLDRDYLADVHRGGRDFYEALGAFLLSAGLTPGQVEEVRAACVAHRRTTESNLRPLTGVRETLGRLDAAGVAIAVFANSEHPAATLRERLEPCLGGVRLGALLSSCDIGRILPEPAAYRRAVEAMGLDAAQVAFVGHDSAQLAGAASAGMATVAFNSDPDAQADVHVDRLDRLLDLIDCRVPHIEDRDLLKHR